MTKRVDEIKTINFEAIQKWNHEANSIPQQIALKKASLPLQKTRIEELSKEENDSKLKVDELNQKINVLMSHIRLSTYGQVLVDTRNNILIINEALYSNDDKFKAATADVSSLKLKIEKLIKYKKIVSYSQELTDLESKFSEEKFSKLKEKLTLTESNITQLSDAIKEMNQLATPEPMHANAILALQRDLDSNKNEKKILAAQKKSQELISQRVQELSKCLSEFTELEISEAKKCSHAALSDTAFANNAASLQSLNEKCEELLKQKESLSAELQVAEASLQKLNKTHAEDSKNIDIALQKKSIEMLRQSLGMLEHQKALALANHSQVDNHLKAAIRDKEALEAEITTLNTANTELLQNVFQVQLRDAPSALFHALAQKIKTQLLAYGQAHPVKQSDFLRHSLIILERGLSFIQSGEAKQDIEEDRIQYYQLCNVLWLTLESGILYPKAAEDDVFLTALYDALEGQLDKSTIKMTMEEAKREPLLTAQILPEPLFQFEAKVYDEAELAFNEMLNNLPKTGGVDYSGLARSSTNLLNQLNVVMSSHDPDYKFGTTILKKATQLLKQPNDQALQTEFRQLAVQIEEGKSSKWKRVAGAMLMFLGAITFIAGILGKVASLFVPLPVALPVAALGVGIFATGLTMFRRGAQKGLSKSADQFLETVAHQPLEHKQ